MVAIGAEGGGGGDPKGEGEGCGSCGGDDLEGRVSSSVDDRDQGGGGGDAGSEVAAAWIWKRSGDAPAVTEGMEAAANRRLVVAVGFGLQL